MVLMRPRKWTGHRRPGRSHPFRESDGYQPPAPVPLLSASFLFDAFPFHLVLAGELGASFEFTKEVAALGAIGLLGDVQLLACGVTRSTEPTRPVLADFATDFHRWASRAAQRALAALRAAAFRWALVMALERAKPPFRPASAIVIGRLSMAVSIMRSGTERKSQCYRMGFPMRQPRVRLVGGT